jgi:hypothetical protein
VEITSDSQAFEVVNVSKRSTTNKANALAFAASESIAIPLTVNIQSQPGPEHLN